MILQAYAEAFAVKVVEALNSPNTVKTRGSWLVIRGTDGVVLEATSYRINCYDTTRVLPVPYLDGATVPTDPNRMKQIVAVQVVNEDNIPHTIQVGTEDVGGTLYFASFVVPAGGSVLYGKDFGWEARDATGKRLDVAGADGTNGTNGTDGWTYLTLESNFANSTVTPSNVTGVTFTGAANTKYEIEPFGVYQTAAKTTGIGLSLSVPSGASVAGFAFTPISTTALGSTMQRADPNPTGATASVDALDSDVPIAGKWVVATAGSSGAIQLRMRSEVASAATLIGGRFFMKYRVIV